MSSAVGGRRRLALGAVCALLSLTTTATAALPDCFERFAANSLLAKPLISLRGMSLDSCFNACVELPREGCRSVTYASEKAVCQLHGKDKSMTRLVHNPMADYYQRSCYDKPSAAVLRDVVTPEAGCYTSTKGKVLIGIVDQLMQGVNSAEACQAACTSSQDKFDIVCKSAMYYSKEKECILASQSKADIPDLFIDDDKATYLENACVGKQDSVKSVVPSGVFKGSSKFSPSDSSDVNSSGTTQTTSTTPSAPKTSNGAKRKGANLEMSGYETPSETVSNVGETDELITTTTTTTTTKPVPTVNPKMIDNYAVEATPKSTYGRRLRDTRVKPCFKEVRPLNKLEPLRVVKAYSLEQCTDMCRLCTRCLKASKCRSVAFDISRELCALSPTTIVDGGRHDDDVVVFHNRIDC